MLISHVFGAILIAAITVIGSLVAVIQDAGSAIVRIERDGEIIFEHRFTTSQRIYAALESPSGHYLLVWYMDDPPRRLTVFRTKNGEKLADFIPGFGGRLEWTFGDKILHSWGCGTNCQVVQVYDIAGGILHSETVSGVKLTPFGCYVVFPSTRAAGHTVYKYDVNMGQRTILSDDAPSVPNNVYLDDSVLVVEYDDYADLRFALD